MITSLDHVALRLKDKQSAIKIFNLLGYEHSDTFELDFAEEGKSESFVLSNDRLVEFFITDGEGIVGKWVKENGPGVHHIAFKTDNIKEDIQRLKDVGIEFTSDEELVCDDLKQIFTKPQEVLGGITIELIERQTKGFCAANVKKLMESTSVDN